MSLCFRCTDADTMEVMWPLLLCLHLHVFQGLWGYLSQGFVVNVHGFLVLLSSCFWWLFFLIQRNWKTLFFSQNPPPLTSLWKNQIKKINSVDISPVFLCWFIFTVNWLLISTQMLFSPLFSYWMACILATYNYIWVDHLFHALIPIWNQFS